MDPQTAEAFRHIPYGIYVLATKRHEQTWAMIASWVSQISYSPPFAAGCPPPQPAGDTGYPGEWFFFPCLIKKGTKTIRAFIQTPNCSAHDQGVFYR